ncbi:MAG TPA: alpha-amylase/4-alpha-glucanotransferase domain-containing protein [Ktedonobacteraceae bacterium]|nr:alpha-amylase/4-alpha-glucanotransferase domain-containing protein [Ktedonobacteraceae bacterium]
MTTNQTSSIHLGLLLHNHQPVGNFPWVFQQTYEESYLPMIAALERHPEVRLSLHYTGSLLDWIEEAHPEFLERIAILVRRNQIEIVSGGYYEPILPSIPDNDKVAQVQRLTSRIQRDFGIQASGMWLAERVWEPGLPRLLREAAIEWTILDDVHFKNVGLEDHDLYGYYATEDQSSILKVFATSKGLRYTIPWRPVSETIEQLRSLATLDGKRIVAMGDDGEKFGSWPETGPYCWGSDGHSGWIDEFFTALEQNSDWLHTIPLGEYARNYPALGRIYLPTSSYIEMTEWALPPRKSYIFGKLLHQLEDERREDILQFMRGGFWRNFLVRYHEVNNQHKKMLRVHDALYKADATPETGLVQLWKAQANDTYWHGLFGGIYMGHVRSAIYHHLIKAENAADHALSGTGHWQRYTFTDFDRDSQDELIVESDQQNLYIDPQLGGTLFEWDMRRSMHNMLSVMTRHEESYHQTLRQYEQERRQREVAYKATDASNQDHNQPASPHTTVRTKEPNLDQLLVIDSYRRYSLIDHFFAPGVNLESFAKVGYEEQGNFIELPYDTQVKQDTNGITITMTRLGQVKRAGALGPLPVRLTKTLFMPVGEEKLVVSYTVHNQSQARLQTRFASEWNIHLLGGGGNDQAYYHIQGQEQANSHFDSTGEVSQVQNFHIGNTWIQQDMGFSLSIPTTLWRFSIDTVTGSEAGFERNHQGSCLTLVWPVLLEADQSWSVKITCTGTK